MKIIFDNDKHNYLDIHQNETGEGIIIILCTGKQQEDGTIKSIVSSVEIPKEQFLDMLEDLNI